VSAEDVEIVRRAIAMTSDGDLGAAFQYLDPAIEWVRASSARAQGRMGDAGILYGGDPYF
jgi:hypothetical protein